jgi:hypothetical protein
MLTRTVAADAAPGTAVAEVTVRRTRAFAILTGLTACAILLQGAWAGSSSRTTARLTSPAGDRHPRAGWRGRSGLGAPCRRVGDRAARGRPDLAFGSAALVVCLGLQSYLGGLTRDQGKDVLTAVHLSLAMAVMGLSAWLPGRARRQTAR